MADTDHARELAARLDTLELRLAEVEAKAAEAEARARDAEARAGGPLGLMDAVLTAVLPAEARGHLRAARKEQLLAVRSLVDTWIERVDRKADEPRRRRRETIPLEDA